MRIEIDEYIEPRVAFVAAAAGAVASPRLRRVLRRGLVVTLAGGLLAADAVAGFARGVARGLKEARQDVEGEAPTNGAPD